MRHGFANKKLNRTSEHRKSLLKNRFGSVDMYNSVLGEKTVENVYFTNAADDSGNFHPFMIIASNNKKMHAEICFIIKEIIKKNNIYSFII